MVAAPLASQTPTSSSSLLSQGNSFMLKNSEMTVERYANLMMAAGIDVSDCTTVDEVDRKLQDILYVGIMHGPIVIKVEDEWVLYIPNTYDILGEESWREIYR